MNLPVALAGSTRSWRTLEGDRISQWVLAGPWFDGPRILVVGASVATRTVLGEVVKSMVRGSDRWADMVKVNVVDSAVRDGTLAGAIAHWMNTDAPNVRVLFEALESLTKLAPRLLVVHLDESQNTAVWLDDAQRLLDLQAKLVDAPAMAVLVVVESQTQPSGCVRVDVAWPIQKVNTMLSDRWHAYVHERVAWHCGGSLALLAGIAPGLQQLNVEDDGALEDALDAHSRAVMASLDEDLRGRLARDLEPAFHNPKYHLPAGLIGPGVALSRPSPWLARGLLLQWPDHPRRRYLRSLRTCRPLADRLLGRCMDLEQNARDRLLREPPRGDASEQAQRHVDELRQRCDHPEHRLTPRGRSPIPDPWDAASFSSVINLDSNLRVRNRLHYLRRTRNALAHGVEVGWGALRMVDDLTADLGDERLIAR